MRRGLGVSWRVEEWREWGRPTCASPHCTCNVPQHADKGGIQLSLSFSRPAHMCREMYSPVELLSSAVSLLQLHDAITAALRRRRLGALLPAATLRHLPLCLCPGEARGGTAGKTVAKRMQSCMPMPGAVVLTLPDWFKVAVSTLHVPNAGPDLALPQPAGDCRAQL